MSRNSVPRTSTLRLTDEMRCSAGSGALSCATTTIIAGLSGTKRAKLAGSRSGSASPSQPWRSEPRSVIRVCLLSELE